MMSNYGIDEEDLALKFEAKKTNWQSEHSDQFNKVFASFHDIYPTVLEEL